MDEAHKKILKMVEDGVISSDEAAELFDSLEQAEEIKHTNQLSEKVDWESARTDRQHQGHSKRTKKEKFLHILEEAVTKIKNVDLDFNFGSFKTISHIFHIKNPEIAAIHVDVPNGSISIESWEEADVRVECEAKVYQADSQDQARHRFLNETKVENSETGEFVVIAPPKQVKVTVKIKVPVRMYEKVTTSTFNGPIALKQLQTKQLVAKTKNGTVNVDQVSSEKADIETANGTIEVKQATIESFTGETINGSIRINGDFKKVEVEAVSGSIHCTWEGDRASTGFFKTVTGGVRLSIPQGKRIDGLFTTNIGNIHCDIEQYQIIEKQNDMMKKLLQIETNTQFDSLLHVEAETKTGSIWVLPIS